MPSQDRRSFLKVSAGIAATAIGGGAVAAGGSAGPAEPPDHERRIAWWRAAKFGMFVTWGPPALYERGDWVTGIEDVPRAEYERLTASWKPRPGAAAEWARLAVAAGMKYMVLVTKHHDGFCLWDTKTTPFCATRMGPGRDLVREYVDAARAAGLRVGIYFSLMDWHHPDGLLSETDPAARRRFVEFTHGQIRELMTNYGKIDILWYDVGVPLDAAGWRSAEMNDMVFRLQPDIVVNNRNWLAGDFATPEQTVSAADRDWESCMTINDSWNYDRGDDLWKSPREIVRNLTKCVQDGGNYIVNIGPTADGAIPERERDTLRAVGSWLKANGEAIYGGQRSAVRFTKTANFTRKGSTLYACIHFRSDRKYTIGGIAVRPTAVRLVSTGRPVAFETRGSQLILSGLPAENGLATVVAIDFPSFPEQNSVAARSARRLHELYKETGIEY